MGDPPDETDAPSIFYLILLCNSSTINSLLNALQKVDDFIILIYFKLSYLEIAVGAVLARVRC
jgi:hypothetical protein